MMIFTVIVLGVVMQLMAPKSAHCNYSHYLLNALQLFLLQGLEGVEPSWYAGFTILAATILIFAYNTMILSAMLAVVATQDFTGKG